MFSVEVEVAIREHALTSYPNECCGYVRNGVYEPHENIHEKPREAFRIDPKKYPVDGSLQAVVHSHPEGYLEPSKSDMLGQLRTGVPWGIVTVKSGIVSRPLWWGDRSSVPALKGRQYRHGPSGSDGAGDCYAIIRDYFLLEQDIVIPEYPRDPDWWMSGGNMYIENFEKAGFERIQRDEMQPGDCVIMQVSGSPVPNHAGVYVGNNLLLHHLYARLSADSPIHIWYPYITHYVRYTGKIAA